MHYSEFSHIVRNAPTPVNFCGLQGTTMSMQSQGWELNVESYADQFTGGYIVRLAGDHRGLDLKLLSFPNELGRGLGEPATMIDGLKRRPFDIAVCAKQITVQVVQTHVPKFQPVDFSRPLLEEMSSEVMGKHFSLEECCFFKTYTGDADLYVPEKEIWTVEKELKRILESQKDRQKELREKARKAARRNTEGCAPSTEVDNSHVKLQLIAC